MGLRAKGFIADGSRLTVTAPLGTNGGTRGALAGSASLANPIPLATWLGYSRDLVTYVHE